MSTLLQEMYLAPEKGKPLLSGLVSVRGEPSPESIAETVAVRQAEALGDIDYVFFRRFSDERSSQVVAYVVDNTGGQRSKSDLAKLHHKVWLNGSAALLYVGWSTQVDVLSCAAGPIFWDENKKLAEYIPSETIEATASISRLLDEHKWRRFSAIRLSNGTFWDDPANAQLAVVEKGAHHRLIQAVIEADRDIDGANDPLMRRLLLLTILIKYLEDREVFPKDWFSRFYKDAQNFLTVLSKGEPVQVQSLLEELASKFNGDVFELPAGFQKSLTGKKLKRFVELLEARTIKKQLYLWEQFSFKHIPVEVLSHLYQHFAQSGKGAVFTPPLVASLMLDYALPYSKIKGDEHILDPTCGSGIFLVGAFRRLVHAWQSKNDWKRPSVKVLKKLLQQSIFGAELQEEAAHIASFNLALAICDALQPKVIWEELRFDKLIGSNILTGDLFSNLTALQLLVGNKGYSTVIGNPPFLSKLTSQAEKTRATSAKDIAIPDSQMAYRIAEEAMTLLKDGGCMCLIQNAGFLYNSKARAFQKAFFTSNQVETVLDFVSIRNLFEGADPKTVAIVATKRKPESDHVVLHQTFRRTVSVKERIGFELDHYDQHPVHQEHAIQYPLIWRANLLGGGRLQNLSLKLSELPTLKDYWNARGWSHGEGFIAGTDSVRKKDKFLPGKPLLPTEALTERGIDKAKIGRVEETNFAAARVPARFTPPMVLIKEHESLPCSFWNNGILAFRDKIVAINAPPSETKALKEFEQQFIANRETLKAACILLGSQALIGKATAILKHDLENLPWDNSKNGVPLSWWEKILLNDMDSHMAPFVRIGQNSDILKKAATAKDFSAYSKIFIKMLGSVYKNLELDRSGQQDGLAYQAFRFGTKSELNWPTDWSDYLKDVVFVRHSEALRTIRIVRFYERNTLIVVKPDRLRHWIGSTAIRDADETLTDLQDQGY